MKNEIMGIKAPAKECTDKKCPFHGEVSVKLETLNGKVVKKDINHSATIEWFRSYYVPKYERYELRRSRLRVHNPACVDAKVGQEVLVAKTRPLSKTKHHVILQIKNAEIAVSDNEESTKKSAKKQK